MTKNKFEQLIEYVINDEEQKARELFHDIVVEKSRSIYEDIMSEEDDAERDDKAEKAGKKVAKDIEYDEKEDRCDEGYEEEVESDEQGMNEADEEEEEGEEEEEEGEEEEESGADEETDGEEEVADGEEEVAGGDIEDRVVDLEDKLDELMAEFESLMGDEAAEHGDEMGGDDETMVPVDDEVGGDAYATDDTSEFEDEPMMENITLAAAPKPTTTEPAGTNTKTPYAANSGARGAMAQPVTNTASESNPDGTSAYKQPSNYASKGETEVKGASSFRNVPGKDNSKQTPAPKPTTSQAAGTNARTPFPKV